MNYFYLFDALFLINTPQRKQMLVSHCSNIFQCITYMQRLNNILAHFCFLHFFCIIPKITIIDIQSCIKSTYMYASYRIYKLQTILKLRHRCRSSS